MKIMDGKGRLFGRISIVDILVILIIAAALGGLYYKFGKSGTVTPFTRTDRIQMSLYAEDVPDFIAKAVKAGDAVKDRVQNVAIGRVWRVETGPDVYFNPSSSGQTVASSKPGYSSITVTIEGQGIYNADGCTFGGVEYYLGKLVEWRVGATDYFAKVSNMKKLGD